MASVGGTIGGMIIVSGDWPDVKVGDRVPLLWHAIEQRNIDQPALVIGLSNKKEYVEFWNKHPKAIRATGPVFLKVLVD